MKTKRVWLVFAGCMLMYGAMMGILFNCAGVLINGVIQSEGYTSSDLAGYYSLRNLVSIAMLFTARLLTKVNIKLMTVLVGAIGSLSFLLMSFYTAPWQWLISGILHGVASSLVMLLPTTVIRNWFIKNRGTFMGAYMMLSGVFGAVFNPITGRMIENVGWRVTARILAAIAFVCIRYTPLRKINPIAFIAASAVMGIITGM